MKVKGLLLSLLMLLPMIMGMSNHSGLSIPANKVKEVTLLTPKQRVIQEFMQYEELYCKANIHPLLGVAQAILEQGWELDESTYRVYNITYSKDSKYAKGYECVWDNGMWVQYRVYKSLNDAVKDYLSIIHLEPRYEAVLSSYEHGLNAQAYAMAHSGYAQMDSEEYYELLLAVIHSINKRL